MDYRSPTIHSSVLKMAGSPTSQQMTGDEKMNNGYASGYDNSRDRTRYCRRNGRGIAHPFLHRREVN